MSEFQKRLDRGRALQAEGKLVDALKVFKAVTRKFPNEDMGWVCRAALEDELGRHTDGPFMGKESFIEALKLRHHPTIINDLANIMLRNELRWEEAEKFYKEAVIRHGLKEAAQNLAVCLLNTATIKRTSEGWREAWQWYEWRDMNKLWNHPRLWRGEPLKGKRLMVQFEQGFGDHLWALRFLKQAKEEGAYVIAVCKPNTIRLCIAQSYIDEVYNLEEDAQFESDYVVMLLSMPGYMLPGSMPVTCSGYVETKQEVKKSSKLRIGIAWNGSVDVGYQAWRNMDLERLRPIIESRPDIEWVSLQKGKHEEDCPDLPIDRQSIKDCYDLWDTTCLVETLDLVISTDTLIPHISGALGVETWLMDRWSSCWQFGIGGPETDPKWYGNFHIFKQKEFGDWTPVLDEISEKVKTWRFSTQVQMAA